MGKGEGEAEREGAADTKQREGGMGKERGERRGENNNLKRNEETVNERERG